MPSLRTSLCMLSGPSGFNSLEKVNYPNDCIRVNIDYKILIIIHEVKDLHPWVKVDQAGRPLPLKSHSILVGLALRLRSLCNQNQQS